MGWAEAMTRTVTCPWRLAPLLLAALLAGCQGFGKQESARPEALAGATPANLPPAAPSEPISVLLSGLVYSMNEAARGLAGTGRAHAVRALDDAMRIADLARYASSGGAQEVISRGADAVHDARHEVQLGRPGDARRRLEAVAVWLEEQARQLGPLPPRSTLPPWYLVEGDARYYGATLLNSRGQRIGEVVGFVRSGDRIGQLVVETGWRDFLGFWDVTGTRLVVPADWAIFGEPMLTGTTHLALAAPVGEEELSGR